MNDNKNNMKVKQIENEKRCLENFLPDTLLVLKITNEKLMQSKHNLRRIFNRSNK